LARTRAALEKNWRTIYHSWTLLTEGREIRERVFFKDRSNGTSIAKLEGNPYVIPMKNLHIMPGERGWKVAEEGAPHAFASFPEKKQAIQTATSILSDQEGSLTIFSKDGAAAIKQFFRGQHQSR
jgi:hypothetical protein